MRKLLVLMLALPSVLFAQPEKVRPGVSLDEFLLICPGAARDWDIEREELSVDTSIGKTRGEMFWSYFNDTIRSYSFLSDAVAGPSDVYPKVDSAKVHSLKVELEKLRTSFEVVLGKPKVFLNIPFEKVGFGDRHFAYKAIWVLPDGRSVQLEIVSDHHDDFNADVPADMETAQTGIFMMEIYVDARQSYFRSKYGVGASIGDFTRQFPQFKGEMLQNENMPAYSFQDTATSENAEWGFDFQDGEMFYYIYSADYGTGYGAKSNEAAYLRMKEKAEELYNQMIKWYGQPDTVTNTLAAVYKAHDLQVSYRRDWLYAKWETTNGPVELKYDEAGGGKYKTIIFSLELEWGQ